MIVINIEVTPQSPIKKLIRKLHSKAEDLLFAAVQILPERFIPSALMEWLDRYTTRRIEELKQQITKDNWNRIYLDKAFSEICARQQDTNSTKAPDKD